MIADTWDPLPHEKQWYRQGGSGGQLGWLVRRNGADRVKLDREAEEITLPFKAGDWVPEREHRPMTVAQLAQVAFEADRVLCFFVGLPANKKKDWVSLSDDQKIAWMDKGPTKHEIRKALYRAVSDALRPFAA